MENLAYTLDIEKIRLIGGGVLLIVILNLAGFIGALVAIDDDWKVLGNNWGKYAYLIILSIIYLVFGIALTVGLGGTFLASFPKGVTLDLKLNGVKFD
jgi:hypothetical protein